MPQLADACAAGDVAAVRRLLAVGNRSKNEKSSAGAPTTVLAAAGGHAEVVAIRDKLRRTGLESCNVCCLRNASELTSRRRRVAP